MSFVDVSNAMGHKNPALYAWKDGTRKCDSVVVVEGVPFINETRCQRVFRIVKRD
jgi:hypothetical protein